MFPWQGKRRSVVKVFIERLRQKGNGVEDTPKIIVSLDVRIFSVKVKTKNSPKLNFVVSAVIKSQTINALSQQNCFHG